MLCIIASSLVFGCEANALIWMPPRNHADPLFRFIRNGRAGFIDAKGRIVVPPALEIDTNNSGQYFTGGYLQLAGARRPFLDHQGKPARLPNFDQIGSFHEGLAPVLPSQDTGMWGYMDTRGRIAIQPKFPGYPNGILGAFSEGLAVLEVDGKAGYLDRTGTFAISPRFVAAKPFTGGLARVVVGDQPCVYMELDHFDPCMNVPSHAPKTQKISTGPSGRQGKLCKWAFIDKSGKQVFPATFDNALAFQEERAAVQVAGPWGFIDRAGGFVIPPSYRAANSFSSGVALVSLDYKTGSVIDRSGNHQFTVPQYMADTTFSEGLLPVLMQRRGPVVYVDTNGNQAFPGSFVAGSRFFHGLAHVQLSEQEFAYIDKAGRRVFTYTK